MIDENNILYPEDFDTLVKRHDDGLCGQLSSLVSMVLNRYLREMIHKLNHILFRYENDYYDVSDCDYEFRNTFEFASWFFHKRNQQQQMIQLNFFDLDIESKIKNGINEAIRRILYKDKNFIAKRLLFAWYWQSLDQKSTQNIKSIVDVPDGKINDALASFFENCIDNQMKKTAAYVEGEIEAAKEERRRFEEKFEYDEEDYYISIALNEIADYVPNNKYLKRAIEFVDKFLNKELTDEDKSMTLSISISYENGGCNYILFELDHDSLIIIDGGSVYDPNVGSDSYSNEIWHLYSFSHTRDYYCDAAAIACEIIASGGKIKDELDYESEEDTEED